MNKKLIIGLSSVLAVTILVTAIAVPVALTSKNKETTTPQPNPVITTKTNTNWRRFVAAEQLHTLTEEQAQFRINQARLFWPTWLDVVEPDGTIKPGATINPTNGAIIPGSIKSVTSITVTDPTAGSLIESINTTNEDLEFAFTDIVYAPDIATTVPTEVQDDLGTGKTTGWKDAGAAKDEMQKILTEVTTDALGEIKSTEDLEDYLEDKDLDDDDAEDAYEAELIALVDLPAEQVDEVEFYVQKVVNGETTTYTLHPIVTLEDDFFASVQPTALTGLTFEKELTQVYEIDWVDNADDTIQKWIDESPTELKTSEAILNFLNTEENRDKILNELLTGDTSALVEEEKFTLEVKEEGKEDNRTEFELILKFNVAAGVELEDEEIDLEIKSSFRNQVAVNWDPVKIQEEISKNTAITDLTTLNDWLKDTKNELIIKNWFTNQSAIKSLTITASGDGPFILTPTIEMDTGYGNSEIVDIIPDLKITNSVNWNPVDVQAAINRINTIDDLDSLKAWLADEANAETIKAWFSSTTNVWSISIVASGNGPFILKPTVTMNPGFTNGVTLNSITNLTIANNVNWNPVDVQTAISENQTITNLISLQAWLGNPINAATIKAWFLPSTNVESVSIEATGPNEDGFTLTPTVTMNPGFTNSATVDPITDLKISAPVDWVKVDVLAAIKTNSAITNLTTLQSWLNDTANAATINGWFTNHENANISVTASGEGPFTLTPNVTPKPGFVNTVTPTSITDLIIVNNVNWNPTAVKATLEGNQEIKTRTKLVNWLENQENQTTIKGWFEENENIQSITFNVSETGPFTITPTVTMNDGFVNTATPVEILGLMIDAPIDWIPSEAVQNTINTNLSITNLETLNTWLDTNAHTLFTNNENATISVTASGNGPFTLTPTVTPKPGFTNTATPTEFPDLTIANSVNWNHEAVKLELEGNSEIQTRQQLVDWLNNPNNTEIINAWFGNNVNVSSITFNVSETGPFTITPTVTMNDGFTNRTTVAPITDLIISAPINWVVADVKQEIEELNMPGPRELNTWLQDEANAATIKAWFSNNENINLISIVYSEITEISASLMPSFLFHPGFENSVEIQPVTITFSPPSLI